MTPMTREWVDKAEADFATAGRELRVRVAPNYDGVCFHAQQSAEKHLKALLQETGQRFGKTHNLLDLIAALMPAHPAFALLQPAAKVLNDYAVDFRYPGKTADRVRARAALAHCKLIRESVRRELGLPQLPAKRAKRKKPPSKRRGRKK